MNRGGLPTKASGARPRQGSAKVLRRLWRYLAKYRWLIVAASLLSVVGNVLMAVSSSEN